MSEDELEEILYAYAVQINTVASDWLDDIERDLVDEVEKAINDNIGLRQIMNDAVWKIVTDVVSDAIDQDETIATDEEAIGDLVKAGLEKTGDSICMVQKEVMKRIAHRIYRLVDDFDSEMERRLANSLP